MATAVQFGAGNVGRGFLGQLFYETGLEVVFVDVDAVVIDALNARRGYAIDVVGPGAHRVEVHGVRAIHASDRERVATEISGAEIVCTAVGANVLRNVAAALAAGLELRERSDGRPLNVLLCENFHDAAG